MARGLLLSGIIVMICSLPGWAQVYGPDGEELPPVPNAPPAAPSPSSPPTSDTSPATWNTGSALTLGNHPWRLGVTAGAFFPVGGLSDRSAGNVWPLLGFSYEIRRPSHGNPYTITAYIEGAASSRTFNDAFGNRMNEVRELYGVGLEVRGYIRPLGPLAAYVGGGIGSYFLRRGIRYDTTASPFLAFDDQSLIDGKYYVRPGVKLLFGLEERHGIFAEFRYLNAGVLEGVRYQGINASIGGRF